MIPFLDNNSKLEGHCHKGTRGFSIGRPTQTNLDRSGGWKWREKMIIFMCKTCFKFLYQQIRRKEKILSMYASCDWTHLTTLSVLAGSHQMGGVPLENRRKKKIPTVLNQTESPHLQLLGCATISLDSNQVNTNDLKAFLLCMYIYLLLVVCFRKLNRITSNRMAKIYHK